ncbi:MAG: methyltransferase, partial [Gammaproteobacteria bacterium]|nr:methyltransferase [Gammaproteobacteria bacterium]
VQVDESELAFDAIRSVGAGGHFFGTAHTIERYRDAFHTPICSDWSNFETWTENGSVQTAERANRLFKSVLETYEEPPLDESVREAVREYVVHRKRTLKPSW